MATLNLTKLWINRLDSGAAISAQTAPGRTRAAGMAGEVRRYAGGRQRSVTAAGKAGSFQFTLRMITFATVLELEDWIGVPVQVRDHRGQRFIGVFYDVPATEHQDDTDMYDAGIALLTITAPEGV